MSDVTIPDKLSAGIPAGCLSIEVPPVIAPHQLELTPGIEMGDAVLMLVEAAYRQAPVNSDPCHDGYHTDLDEIPGHILAQGIVNTSQDHVGQILAEMGDVYGRLVNIMIRRDGPMVIGLYDEKDKPLPFAIASKILEDAVNRYELLLAEREFNPDISYEPLPQQLAAILLKIQTKFAGVDPEVKRNNQVISDIPPPTLDDAIQFISQITGWAKVENPKHPNSIIAFLANGDYVSAKPRDGNHSQDLIFNYISAHGNPNPPPNQVIFLWACLRQDEPSYLRIETADHRLDFKTEV